MAIGSVGCGDGAEDEQPRSGEIRTTIEELWEAAGVKLEDTTWSDYVRQSKRDSVGCADLPNEADRWVASRSSSAALEGRLYPRDQVWDGTSAYLEDKGFRIDRYQFPGSGRLELRAEREELVVFVDVSRNGASQLEVFAGPCAPFMGDERPEGVESIP